MALRGIDFISATAFLAEIGDLSRFRTPPPKGLVRFHCWSQLDERGEGPPWRNPPGSPEWVGS
jgi:hypothetical protein